MARSALGRPGTAAGVLAARDPAQWYTRIVFERWREDRDSRGLPSFLLELFYVIKRFIPRSVQLGLRRRLIARQGLPAFPQWPFDAAGAELFRSRSPMRCWSGERMR